MKKRRLFIGGVPWAADESKLKEFFEEGDGEGTEGCGSGTIEIVTIVRDRETGKSRGFAFITMSSLEKAKEAIDKFDGIKFQGRTLKVDEAADQSTNRRMSDPMPFRSAHYNSEFKNYPEKRNQEY